MNKVIVAKGTMTCNKCGTTKSISMECPAYFEAYDITDIVNKKMIHMCNKAENKCGIMSVTDITLIGNSDVDHILDNTIFDRVPIKKDIIPIKKGDNNE